MKRSTITLFFLILSTALKASMPNAIVVPEMCENITRRTYFISRLERTVNILKSIDIRGIPFVIDSCLFTHPELIETIACINKDKTLEHIFTLWEKLKSYKNIDDFLLMQEFTKLILILPWQLQQYKKIIKSIKPDIRLSLEGTSYVEAVTLRRYYTERLRQPVQFLTLVPCAQKEFFEASKPGCDCSFITNYDFIHPEIKKTINRLHEENNLLPIVKLSQEFEKLKLINDSLFQKEFMLLVFTAYRNLIINNASKYHLPVKKSTLELIIYLYENIDRIPLEKILDAIDLLAEELPSLLEKYEFKKEIGWQEWFKKYWWIAGIGCAGLSYKLLRIFYPTKRAGTGRPSSTSLLPGDNDL